MNAPEGNPSGAFVVSGALRGLGPVPTVFSVDAAVWLWNAETVERRRASIEPGAFTRTSK